MFSNRPLLISTFSELHGMWCYFFCIGTLPTNKRPLKLKLCPSVQFIHLKVLLPYVGTESVGGFQWDKNSPWVVSTIVRLQIGLDDASHRMVTKSDAFVQTMFIRPSLENRAYERGEYLSSFSVPSRQNVTERGIQATPNAKMCVYN